MKYIITIIAILISNFAIGQIEYPRFEIDSLGKTVVVMTIEQAQKLDNSTDLVILFENASSKVGSYDSICIKVINNQEQIIATQNIKISELNGKLKIKDDEIKVLKSLVDNYEKDILAANSQLENSSKIIDEQKKTIKKQRFKMIFGGGIGAVAIGVLLLIVIL